MHRIITESHKKGTRETTQSCFYPIENKINKFGNKEFA